MPLATTDAVRLGEREGASSFVHTCTALDRDEERKGEEGGEEGRKGRRRGRRGRETEDEKREGALLLICRGSPYHDHQSVSFLTGSS